MATKYYVISIIAHLNHVSINLATNAAILYIFSYGPSMHMTVQILPRTLDIFTAATSTSNPLSYIVLPSHTFYHPKNKSHKPKDFHQIFCPRNCEHIKRVHIHLLPPYTKLHILSIRHYKHKYELFVSTRWICIHTNKRFHKRWPWYWASRWATVIPQCCVAECS